MSISVHTISMLYELRALRSRLADILSQEGMVWTDHDTNQLIWCHRMADQLIRQTERTGEFIASLEARAQAQEEADLGSEVLRSPDHGRGTCDGGQHPLGF